MENSGETTDTCLFSCRLGVLCAQAPIQVFRPEGGKESTSGVRPRLLG